MTECALSIRKTWWIVLTFSSVTSYSTTNLRDISRRHIELQSIYFDINRQRALRNISMKNNKTKEKSNEFLRIFRKLFQLNCKATKSHFKGLSLVWQWKWNYVNAASSLLQRCYLWLFCFRPVKLNFRIQKHEAREARKYLQTEKYVFIPRNISLVQ